jgi:hypothetical protein
MNNVYQNINYRSGFEVRIAKALVRSRVPFRYEPYSLKYTTSMRNGTCKDCGGENVGQFRSYTPDFVSTSGSFVVEAKGKWVGRDRTKILEIIKQHPDVTFYMLFMRNNWLTTKRKTKYSDWCNAHGIEFSIGVNFPKKWKEEFKNDAKV